MRRAVAAFLAAAILGLSGGEFLGGQDAKTAAQVAVRLDGGAGGAGDPTPDVDLQAASPGTAQTGNINVSGRVLVGAGSVAAPSLALGTPDIGFHVVSDSLSYTSSSTLLFTTQGVAGLRFASGAFIGWTPGAPNAQSADAALSRLAPGALAIGNGTAGDFSGSTKQARLYIDYTNTATVGAVAINKAAGRVNIAAAGTSVVVTNSLVTAASHVFAVVSQADATAYVRNVVPAAGSFTITLGAAATAQVSIDFFIVSAD